MPIRQIARSNYTRAKRQEARISQSGSVDACEVLAGDRVFCRGRQQDAEPANGTTEESGSICGKTRVSTPGVARDSGRTSHRIASRQQAATPSDRCATNTYIHGRCDNIEYLFTKSFKIQEKLAKTGKANSGGLAWDASHVCDSAERSLQ